MRKSGRHRAMSGFCLGLVLGVVIGLLTAMGLLALATWHELRGTQ